MRTWISSVMVIAAACSGAPGAGAPDAANPDAAPGSCPHVAPSVPVGPAGVVQVLTKMPDTAVVFQDGAGTQLVQTDASGNAHATIHAPATVTLVSSDWRELTTITGVEPGDALCLACESDPSVNGSTINVTAPAYPGARDYTFTNGEERRFGSGGASSAVLAQHVSGPHDVVAIASDELGRPLAWAAAPAQSTAGGGTIALDAWHPPGTFTATIDHLPGGPAHAWLDREEMSTASVPTLEMLFAAGQLDFVGPTATVSQTSTSFGGAAMAVHVAVGIGDRVQDLRVIAPAAATFHVDASTEMLPWVTDLAYDPCTHTLSWKETGGTPGDGAWVDVFWHDGTTDWSYDWRVLVAPGTTSVQFPALPPLPKPAVVRDPELPPRKIFGGSVHVYDLADVTSYAAMRSHVRIYSAPPFRASNASFTQP